MTNLDEGLAARALVSLGAEITRRERLLAESGARDFEDHRRLVGSGSGSPLPRLVIVVDEFRLLAEELPEALMGGVSALTGSSPAYICMLIEAMADAGVYQGIPRAQAIRLAAQAVLGTAKLVLESGKHPELLKDEVCSPGGTTIRGVAALEQRGFRGAILDAINLCAEASKGKE